MALRSQHETSLCGMLILLKAPSSAFKLKNVLFIKTLCQTGF